MYTVPKQIPNFLILLFRELQPEVSYRYNDIIPSLSIKSKRTSSSIGNNGKGLHSPLEVEVLELTGMGEALKLEKRTCQTILQRLLSSNSV